MILRLSIVFITIHSLRYASGTCHTCQSNFAKCHDETRFSMCVEGISEKEVFSCPDDYVCTAETSVCVKSSAADPVEPVCEPGCEVCTSPEKLFACLDATTYAYCFGEDTPNYLAAGTCPIGYVCNLNSEEVCTKAADVYPSCYKGVPEAPTTLDPSITTEPPVSITTTTTPSTSSSSTTSTSTTPSTTSTSTRKPLDDKTFCAEKQTSGFFKAEDDPTCQQFIYCYLLSGEYLSMRYVCNTYEYFNEATGKCGPDKPADCL